MTPAPTLPSYAGANVRGIVPALLAPRGAALPAWMPAPVHGARQVVLLVVDGLGWEQLQERRTLAPTLAALAGGPITTVAPSTTGTALTSITTGLTPGEHGVVGYRMEMAGEVLNVLRWSIGQGDSRRQIEPASTQPFTPFLGERVPVVSKAELEHSAFSEAHLRGGVPASWRAASSLPVLVGDLLRAGERFVYAYYDGIDKIAHERGFGAFYDAELQAVDRLVADVQAQLPPGAALLITADHGQVQVGDRLVTPHADVLRLCRIQSGEGRFRWLHARPGATAELLAAAREHHGAQAWVHSRAELIEAGWFGPVVSPPVAARYGDVALAAHAPISFDDPADSGPFPLVCRHGSLTSAEMLVPLLAAAG
ncbi:MAG: alkaline phosphatase family protein [Actinomycetota bacterium]|nr:alkaline phosphatase family protein [Actinomycetota bacterium]